MDPEEQFGLLASTTASPENLASTKVFPFIRQIWKDAIKNIDAALNWEQLNASDVYYAITRPLVAKYAQHNNLASVYACLVVRSHFIHKLTENLAYSALMMSRANFCEILAMKLLTPFSSHKITMGSVLTTSWNPLAGAPASAIAEIRDILGGKDLGDPQNALEMAIATEAKSFLATPLVQAIVNDIYSGTLVYNTKASHRSLLADNYKPKPIQMYVYKPPFSNHYRLRVPRYRAILQFFNFSLLLSTFVVCLYNAKPAAIETSEVVFIIFASAFALQEYTASKEHGWGIYFADLWNVFDFSFVIIFLLYLALRIRGLVSHDDSYSSLGLDILACGACILFPRLAFFAVRNHVVIIALRAMISEFVFFMGIAVMCFSGLLFTLHSLASDRLTWTFQAIAWLMIQIWFGSTALSFAQASSFHPVFGPILMTMFAAMSNTLLLTILVSILSDTFSRINENANKEHLFQFTISTVERVKSDALFGYLPPFNLLAFLILWPLSRILTPRALHTVNVFLIKVTAFPILLIIGVYEGHFLDFRQGSRDVTNHIYKSIKSIQNMLKLKTLVGSNSTSLHETIFDITLSQEDELYNSDDEDGIVVRPTSFREDDNHSRSRSPAPRLGTVSGPDSPMVVPPTPVWSGRPLTPSLRVDTVRSEMPGAKSPLGRLFSGLSTGSVKPEKIGDESFKRIESLLEDIKELPSLKIKNEITDLGARQVRIEKMLADLTRRMIHD